MTDLMIEQMNKEQQLFNQIKALFSPYMHEELAHLKANEVMRITGNSFNETSSDDACPYCGALSNEDGDCLCAEQAYYYDELITFMRALPKKAIFENYK